MKAPGAAESMQGGTVEANSRPRMSSRVPRMPWWLRLVPFFLSAFLFFSGFFAVLAPLPILILSLQSKRRWSLLAAATNAALVAFAGGYPSLAVYAVFVLALGLFLPEFTHRRRKLESVVGLTLLSMALVGGLLIVAYAQMKGVPPLTEVRSQVSGLLDFVMQSASPEIRSGWLGDLEPEEWKQRVIVELPSYIAIFSLVLVWANLMISLRLNPGRVRERLGVDAAYFRHWKAPEWLIWPSIVSGFFLVADFGAASDVAVNVFQFLMAVYAIQGLSILSFLFDGWGVKGVFRALGNMVAVLLMLPLLLSLGFFDTWFDFRAKLRQS